MSRSSAYAPNFVLVGSTGAVPAPPRRKIKPRLGKWTRWHALIGTALVLATAASTVNWYIQRDILEGLPTVGEFTTYQEPMPSAVIGSDGKPIYAYSPDLRSPISIDDVPQSLMDAIIADTDPDFMDSYERPANDAGDLAAKIWDYAVHGITLDFVASPIDRFVIERLVPMREPSLTNSLKYAVLVDRMNRGMTRRAILGAYINMVPMGHYTIGFQAAAKAYFGKRLQDLNLAQIASLVALGHDPERLSSLANADEAVSARAQILDRMRSAHMIDANQAALAKAAPLEIQVPKYPVYNSAYGYFTEEVYHEVTDIFGAGPSHGLTNVATGGLQIHTSLDTTLQAAAQDALSTGLLNFDTSTPRRSFVAHLKLDPANWRDQIKSFDNWVSYRDWRLGLVLTNNRFGTTVGFADGSTGALVSGQASVSAGHVIAVAPAGDRKWELRVPPAISGAMVVEDPHTGRVLAMAGGFDFGLDRLNRATDVTNAPGSAISPFVYAAALDNNLAPNSLLSNSRFCVTANIVVAEKCFVEGNSKIDSGYHTLRWGLENDHANMTARIAQKLGMDNVINTFKSFGLGPYHPLYPYAQGSGPTSLLTLTNAYAALDDVGRYRTPHLIDYITDRSGNVLWTAPHEKPVQATDPRTAYQIIEMLHGVTVRGTASGADALAPHIFAKTGVSLSSNSTWFVAGTPNMVAGIYMGFDRPKSLASHPLLERAGMPVFAQFLRANPSLANTDPFPVPRGITFHNIIRDTGRVLPGPALVPSGPKATIIPEAFKF